MACGKPVIGTRVGGIPEVIEDGHSGFLISRGDYQALAQKILQLAADPQLRSQMGQAGRQLASTRFELGDIVRQVMELYGIAKANGLS